MITFNLRGILPVFAGMVPTHPPPVCQAPHSPRIRGDGPSNVTDVSKTFAFSPYSRGWSHDAVGRVGHEVILPVFAGMVP